MISHSLARIEVEPPARSRRKIRVPDVIFIVPYCAGVTDISFLFLARRAWGRTHRNEPGDPPRGGTGRIGSRILRIAPTATSSTPGDRFSQSNVESITALDRHDLFEEWRGVGQRHFTHLKRGNRNNPVQLGKVSPAQRWSSILPAPPRLSPASGAPIPSKVVLPLHKGHLIGSAHLNQVLNHFTSASANPSSYAGTSLAPTSRSAVAWIS